MKILKLKKEEKKVFVHLIISAFFYGFFLSFILIKEIIARKALDATDFQLSLLVMIFPVTSVFSIWWGKLLERTVDKSKYFLLIYIQKIVYIRKKYINLVVGKYLGLL